MDTRPQTICTILALIVIIAGCQPAATTTQTGDTVMEGDAGDDADSMDIDDDAMMESTPDVTFVLTGENFAFYGADGEENPQLRVEEGDLVRIEFASTSGFHDWVLDEFGAATDRVRDGEGMTVVEFVADQTGEFEYYCSVGSHRAQGMWGVFIVE